ncbi:MAG: glycerol kinase GlpK [Chloroflexi bacterium]|nr:glycerol kinase GlpK [Chloroflexota bacterium]
MSRPHPCHVLAIDQGTTGTTALIVGPEGTVVARGYREITQHYPRPGWVEHDPDEIWERSLAAVDQTLATAGLTSRDLAAIGIANQRETTMLWDARTGRPVDRAIVWQCRRTAPLCEALKQTGHEPLIRARTGLVVDAYFSGTKMRWLLDRDPARHERAASGELRFGTVDSWLLWKLTGGRLHATDCSNASRTLLYNVYERRWDPTLLELLGVPVESLPAVLPSSGHLGETVGAGPIGAGVPIAGVAGDQQAALFGQGCDRPGMAKSTYGTGSFLLMHTGPHAAALPRGLLTTIAWGINGGVEYALEGAVFIAGAAVQWLRDELGLLRSAADSEALARSIPDTGGVYLVPAFVGLGSPHWDMYARGTILGLTRGTNRAHLVRAALEAIAYQTRDVVDAMSREAGIPLGELRVDGGAAANDFLCQFQADILEAPVVRPRVTETTGLGAAYLAGLAVGVWRSRDELAGLWQAERRFEPRMPASERERLYGGWRRAIERSRAWATE